MKKKKLTGTGHDQTCIMRKKSKYSKTDWVSENSIKWRIHSIFNTKPLNAICFSVLYCFGFHFQFCPSTTMIVTLMSESGHELPRWLLGIGVFFWSNAGNATHTLYINNKIHLQIFIRHNSFNNDLHTILYSANNNIDSREFSDYTRKIIKYIHNTHTQWAIVLVLTKPCMVLTLLCMLFFSHYRHLNSCSPSIKQKRKEAHQTKSIIYSMAIQMRCDTINISKK